MNNISTHILEHHNQRNHTYGLRSQTLGRYSSSSAMAPKR
ncbi:unnamed protein product [Spirodela intermedia]|uniref:Uncharacterized protein n=1 Tax=Spirodela intermedia TaxID=51605 RepID=A0A7I8K4H4_SPIIN|nr:unnamed protein product [Spirodela intermedia]